MARQKKVSINDLEKVMESMTDSKKVEEIKQCFYVEAIMGTCTQILKTYPKQKGEDRALAFVVELFDKDLINAREFLEISLDIVAYDLEEGEADDE